MNNENFNYILCILVLIMALIALGILWFNVRKSHKQSAEKIQIHEALSLAGYSYDSRQDIFYSNIDAWQKDFGYSQIYDEAAAAMSMIIDSEPIRFNYGGRKWLIELWKGQYGMTTGAEIGVYSTSGPDLEIPGVADATFYECADEEDYLYMAFILRKNGKILFQREARHWWLTGFVLGEFSDPEDLHMEVSITFKDSAMRRAFVEALLNLGYSKNHISVLHTTVWLFFRNPLSPQPLTRNAITDAIVQKKNRTLCDRYHDMTKGYTNSLDKLAVLWDKAPELFESVLRMGKPLELFKQ